MTRTLSYARTSSNVQTDTYSLESQRDRAAAYAKFKGWPAPLHFADEAVSGRKDTRPGLTALLSTVKPGDVILTKDVTRIGRGGIVQTMKIIGDIEAQGGSVVFIDQNLDTSTSMGRLLLGILAGFSQMELEQTRERSMIGKFQAASKGHWPAHSAPYGYRRNNATRQLELDPQTAPHARAAIETLGGRSLREAQALLNQQGIPAATGKWSFVQLSFMLRNTAYIGTAIYRSGGVRIEVPCPRLVSDEAWAAARHREASEGGTKKPTRYPLTGHLRCIHGAPYLGGLARANFPPDAPYLYYQLGALGKKRYGCSCSNANAVKLEEQAREILATLLSDPNDPARIHLSRPALPDDPHEAERRAVTEQLDRLARLQVSGAIELETYMSLRSDLKAQERDLMPPKLAAPVVLPAMLEHARLARLSNNVELAALLDSLSAHFVLHPDKRLELRQIQAFEPRGN